MKAADITLSTNGLNSSVYFNVRKQKIDSHVIMQASMLDDIIKILTIEDPQTAFNNKPKYVGVDINDTYRGRVVINKTYKGSAVTIRLLPNKFFDNTLEDCNLKPQTINFLRNDFMNRENGLRLVAGPTMSGKNTTILACLNELLHLKSLKLVSIEMPVEQELPGIEQINCTTMDEYKANINSLIRQNPDFVYVTEMNDDTSVDVLRAANTGKRSISTIHANSCSDIIPRLMDITGLSIDRIIQPIHSLVYQELVRDESKDMLVPVNRYVYLSQERKKALYGKPFGEVMNLIDTWEGGDIW
jgi:type II secretory ATPase GspE/PulE/Tfp pilus assembly ATPase PilB-like protein